MKRKISLIWKLPLLFLIALSCTELDLNETNKGNPGDLSLDARSSLSKELLDSTLRAERLAKTNENVGPTQETFAIAATSVNYAPQATVSAESTYPGYSVLKIKDRIRTTTVGPSYSWANNFPAGGKLPESVFLKFTSLKTVDRIDIYTSSGYALQNYTIQYRITPTGSWKNLVVVTGNTAIIRTHTFAAVNLLEVQIICQLGPPNQTIYGRLNEVEIYGPAEPPLPPISTENGMLVFNSLNDINLAVDYLEYKYDQYSDAFVSQYPGYTDDQLADVEDVVGFNDEQPYLDFENQYGITSLRSVLTAQEENWLATTSGDEFAGSPDPDDSYMDDVEVRTLVNQYGEIKVGSLYYVFLSDGSYYQYAAGGGTSTTSLRNLQPGEPLPANVKHISPESAMVAAAIPVCRATVKNKGWVYNGDKTWRMKYKVKASDGPFGGPGKAKAITKSARKKNGRWKNKSATIGAYVYGSVVGTDCTGGTNIESNVKEKKRRKVKVKVYYTNGRVLNGGVISEHWHSKITGFHRQALTW